MADKRVGQEIRRWILRGLVWHMHFGTMCKQREADLWPADPATKRDGNFYSGILADLDTNGNVFEAKAELVEVLRELVG